MKGQRTKEDDAVIGRRLKELRKALGVPRERLALDLGMGSENVRHYESGRNTLKAPDLPAIADSLGISLGDLILKLFGEHVFSHYGAGAPAATAAAGDGGPGAGDDGHGRTGPYTRDNRGYGESDGGDEAQSHLNANFHHDKYFFETVRNRPSRRLVPALA